MRDASGDVHDIARGERMEFATGERGAEIFASFRASLLAGHDAAHHELTFARVDHDNVDDLVVLFGIAIGIAVEQAEAMVAVVRQGFARGVIRRDGFHENGFAFGNGFLGPEIEGRFFGSKHRDEGEFEQGNSDEAIHATDAITGCRHAAG